MKNDPRVATIDGWLLIARDDEEAGSGRWYIAWHELFWKKKEALAYAKNNGWCQPYRAIRGKLTRA